MTRPSRDGGADPIRPAETELSLAVRRVLADNHTRFLHFVRRRVGADPNAEEILHDAVARAIARSGDLRDAGAIVPWFYRLLRNAAVDRARAASAERRGLAALARELAVETDPGADDDLTDTICACIGDLVAALRTDYATALRRVDLGGEPVGRYARAAGISPGNASVRLHRARRALRRAVDRHCGACAEHGGYRCECRAAPHAASSCHRAG